jgi:hypothetical protein
MTSAPSIGGRTTYQQTRTKLALVFLVSLGFVALGVSFALHPDFWQTSRHSAASIQILGWVGVVFFSVCTIAAVISFFKPTTVRFSPQGLSVKTVWRTRSRPWSALSNFRIWETRGTKIVVFDDEIAPTRWLAGFSRAATGANSALPTLMNASPEHLLDAAQRAKERWG